MANSDFNGPIKVLYDIFIIQIHRANVTHAAFI